MEKLLPLRHRMEERAGERRWVTDIGSSDLMRRLGIKPAMFCRLIAVRDFVMTSGFTFGFEPEYVPGILQACRQKTKKVPPAALAETRFVFFFKKHKQCGIEATYQDVV